MVVGVISLGCDKNRVDTEVIMTALCSRGYEFSGDVSACDILLVNTCAFLESAREESIDAILEAAAYKQDRCRALVVAGCLPMKYLDELKQALPEVDVWLTPERYESLGDELDALFERDLVRKSVPSRLLTTPEHYAYLKISDGCDNFCTYCLIPYIRGRFRSVPPEKLYKEAEGLVRGGVKELILVGQDTTRYGKDHPEYGTLAELICSLSKIEGLELIRVLYCYPEKITDDLIECFRTCKKLAPYIDMPLQHASTTVLHRMNRHTDKESILRTIRALRSARPDLAIRTTMMVGFPGETEQEFEELLSFLDETKLEHVGFFAYSREEGTRSYDFDGQVPEEIKLDRLARAIDSQSRITQARHRAMIGQVVEARYEGIDYDRDLFIGRSHDCAPEVDPKIYFTAKFADIGEVYRLKIVDTDGCDLLAQMVE